MPAQRTRRRQLRRRDNLVPKPRAKRVRAARLRANRTGPAVPRPRSEPRKASPRPEGMDSVNRKPTACHRSDGFLKLRRAATRSPEPGARELRPPRVPSPSGPSRRPRLPPGARSTGDTTRPAELVPRATAPKGPERAPGRSRRPHSAPETAEQREGADGLSHDREPRLPDGVHPRRSGPAAAGRGPPPPGPAGEQLPPPPGSGEQCRGGDRSQARAGIGGRG